MDKSTLLLLVFAVNAAFGQSRQGEEALEGCDSRFDAAAQGRAIVSYDHPQNYPNSHDCRFDVVAPPGHSVYVIFEKFKLEAHDRCQYDFLQLFDGVRDSTSLGKLCGPRLPQPVKSTGSRVHFHFHTDSSVTFSGFKLRFFFCENRACCKVKTINTSGSISSPRYPLNHPANSYCTYHLLADKPWKRISLTFERFRLEHHARCQYDNVTVRTGFLTSSCTSGPHCGSAAPPPVVSPSNKLTVTFQSDAGVQHRGFRANYRVVDEGTSVGVDMCAINNGCCAERCVSVNGHPRCLCGPGKILEENGRTCRYPRYCDLPWWQRRQVFAPNTRVVPGEHYTEHMGGRNRTGVVKRVRPTLAYVCWFNGGCSNYRLCGSGRWELSLENPQDRWPILGQLLIPECGADNGGCPHNCRMVQGRAECSCFDGFVQLSGNRSSCVVDGCSNNNGGCSDICNALPGGQVLCSCPAGWSVRPDGNCRDIDECVNKNGGCQQRCVNTEGSFRCECGTISFQLAANGRNCSDVDECKDPAIHHCEQKCVNTHGSFFCKCNAGYQLSANGRDCEDEDECFMGPGMRCQQKCENTPGSFRCACHVGYRVNPDHNMTCLDFEECRFMAEYIREEGNCLGCRELSPMYECTSCKDGFEVSPNKTWCYDKNECLNNNGGCDHICVNTPGSHRCVCLPGYHQMNMMQGQSLTNLCVNIDECAEDGGNCSHTCTDLPGSYKCSCPRGSGLDTDNRTCVDINECSTENGGCRQICNNIFGNYSCSCRQGFFLADDHQDCIDNNECSVGNGGCQGNTSSCENTVGSYRCRCGAGYQLAEDSRTCQDVNECSPEVNNCDHSCTNSPGSYRCSCDTGYVLNTTDKHTCHDIDECLSDRCDGTCHNTAGSYFCRCPPGFQLAADNHSCEDINECSGNTSPCEQICQNTRGSFQCQCGQGYRLAPNRRGCVDIDECSSPIEHCCNQQCNNTDGSYRCGCDHGFYLDGDGCTCRDVLECSNQNGGCEQVCVEQRGSYRCECLNGYMQDQFNRTQCHDINECLENNGGCEQTCINQPGSYECQCGPLFKLHANGLNCTRCPTCETFTELVTIVQTLAQEVASLRAEVAVLKADSNHSTQSVPATTEDQPQTTQPPVTETPPPPTTQDVSGDFGLILEPQGNNNDPRTDLEETFIA